jgi:hypothetical protein
MAAAISAARHGGDVFLFEKTAHVGGTVVNSLIHTIGGLYDSSGEFLNEGLPVELAHKLFLASSQTRMRKIGRTHVLNVSPDVYKGVVEAWMREESKIRIFCESELIGVDTKNGLVRWITVSTPDRAVNLQPKGLIDTTGSAEIIRMINPEVVIDNPCRAAGGLIFQMRGVEPGTMTFPHSIEVLGNIRRAAQKGVLPSECARAWIDMGVYDDEVYGKLFVPLTNNWIETEVFDEISQKAERTVDELAAFLVTLPGFLKSKVTHIGKLGIRDGGQVKGEYCLTEVDVTSGRKFPDAACRCCWPIEHWDQKKGVTLEYLPNGSYYEIPLRALKVRNMENVWTAGKCLSAEPRAQASARIVGCCFAMGEAVGKAAVEYRSVEE